MKKISEWEDRTKGYGENEIITGSSIKFGVFRLSVHHHIYYDPDVWLASSPDIIDAVELKSKDLKEAKCQAKAMLQVILQDAIDEMI